MCAIDQQEVCEGYIRDVSYAATSAIWWVAIWNASPRLDVARLTIVYACDIRRGDMFDVFESVVVLSNGTHGNADSCGEVSSKSDIDR